MPNTAALPLSSGYLSASSDNSRVDWVDYAKGICIVLVVMMHSTLGVEKAAGETGWLGLVVEFSRPFRMPDFFLISGLFLGLVIDRPWRRYFDRKVVHFLYFYILWLSIQFAFKAPGWMAEGASSGELVQMYLMSFVEPFGTLWFIYMLPVFFILTRLMKGLPWWMPLGAAALLEALPVHTGWVMVDEFAARYVYFLAGYLFACRIFDWANWVRGNRTLAVGMLAAWMAINAVLVFNTLSFDGGVIKLADLPVISLMLGMAGAMAIVAIAVLLSAFSWSRLIEYLGRNSIVVYLAFFLPMAVSRIVLLKFAPFLDVGTVSALVTASGVAGPVILYLIIQWTGYGKFLFHRPDWAWMDKTEKRSGDAGKARLQPAE